MALRRRPSLLILRALGIGDVLTAVPAIRALAERFPDHHRLLAAPERLRPLIAMIGFRDGEHEPGYPPPTLRAVDEVLAQGGLRRWAAQPPAGSLAINLHGRGPQSHRLLLESRPHRLVAFENREVPATVGGPKWRQDEHEVDRWCRLLTQSGIPAAAAG